MRALRLHNKYRILLVTSLVLILMETLAPYYCEESLTCTYNVTYNALLVIVCYKLPQYKTRNMIIRMRDSYIFNNVSSLVLITCSIISY